MLPLLLHILNIRMAWSLFSCVQEIVLASLRMILPVHPVITMVAIHTNIECASGQKLLATMSLLFRFLLGNFGRDILMLIG